MKHIREAKLCSAGTRIWFQDHGFSWSDFLENGIPVEKLAETGDPLALRVVEAVKREEENGRQ